MEIKISILYLGHRTQQIVDAIVDVATAIVVACGGDLIVETVELEVSDGSQIA